MKTNLLVLVLALVATSSSGAAADAVRALVHPVKAVEVCNGNEITRGRTTLDVITKLGVPPRKHGETLWAYPHFGNYIADDCDILLLTFENKRLVDIQLVNERAERVLAARQKERSATSEVAVTVQPRGTVTP